MIQQKQPHLLISILTINAYKHGDCVIAIGKIPKKLQVFFKPVKKQVSEHVYACLTCVGLKAQCAQGQNKSKKVLRLESISKLKDRMRRIVW